MPLVLVTLLVLAIIAPALALLPTTWTIRCMTTLVSVAFLLWCLSQVLRFGEVMDTLLVFELVLWGGVALRHWSKRIGYPPGCCHRCGYDLTGNASGTCPECGECIVNENNSVPSASSCSEIQEKTEATEDSNV